MYRKSYLMISFRIPILRVALIACRTIASSLLLFHVFSSVCHGLVETCEELQAAFDLTKTQNVVIQVHPFVHIDCVDFTTMSMDSNTLTVESSENIDNFHGNSNLNQIRFEVTNGAKLFWETNVILYGSDRHDVDGGGLFIGEGSTIRFKNNVEMVDFGVRSVPEEGSDYASYFRSGGCVYTDGYFRVDGEATFTNCDVRGGPGGGLFVGGKGSVLFNGGLDMSDISIFGEFGTNGGGIYNEGKVNVKGDAKFENLAARSGGAIYNAVGAQFRFKNGANADFLHCTMVDGTAGALHNEGYLKFSGPAIFVDTETPAIFISSDGNTVLSGNSVFRDTYVDSHAAILVAAGGELVIPNSVIFLDNETECSRVNYLEDDDC